MQVTFLAMIFRMKYIQRWILMHNTQPENLSQHSIECAFIAHFLSTVGNCYFDKNYDSDKLAMCALFHDASEILTGDLPTPIKYFNQDIKNAYKKIEAIAFQKLLGHLPKELLSAYISYFNGQGLSDDEQKILKISDKLCAYIKCISELNAGNREFSSAYIAIRKEIESIQSEELAYFLEHCLQTFSLSLDDLKGTL